MESPSAPLQQSPSSTNPAPVPSIPAAANNPPSTNPPNNGPTADTVPMEDVVSTNAVTAEVIARQNQAVVEEFQYLLEKSQQLFAGLRDLPPTGAKQWQPYFQKTFEVFSKNLCLVSLRHPIKLWRFQQQNRFVLENSYGLKRWEVGEIASKIGQLYYHYYLRTSETNYLQESYVFYDAIRERRYFSEISDIKRQVKRLLLNNRDNVSTLKDELAALVKEYIAVYRPPDAAEWQLVVQEVSSFTDAERKLHPVNAAGSYLPVARRLHVSKIISAALDKEGSSSTKLRLQEAILVGNAHNQIKFSELTIDMYRILQSLERETSQIRSTSDTTTKDASSNPATAATTAVTNDGGTNIPIKEEPAEDQSVTVRRNTEKGTKRLNPHKYLLYRPTLSQLMVYLATAFKEVSSDSALLIYLSADGSKRSAADHSGTKGYHGGILTNSRKVADNTDPEQQSISHCLHPGDLLPFTRKPMFLIVDSNNSVAFADMPRVFNHPFMSLLSPTEYPASIPDTSQVGGLFTLFLHAPLLAFSFICGIDQISPDTWEQCSGLITQAEGKIAELMATAPLGNKKQPFLISVGGSYCRPLNFNSTFKLHRQTGEKVPTR
ncbi:hypothetical protein BGZ80_000530 [Entomortierella chlamydospora]|uniref:Protein SCAI n=1 Tax=Entomortierella chlamydospora TaxID=101097 RepID=A0A9P6N220_9FUNG|nr:hypothetical protein BGZ80_000530 [Entomortierella chlamydospora]